MDTVPYNFCALVADCSLVGDGRFEEFSEWSDVVDDAQLEKPQINVQLMYLESGIWKYRISHANNRNLILTIQELTTKPNFRDYRINELQIYTDKRSTCESLAPDQWDTKDFEALDRPLSAFLDVISFLSSELSLSIRTPLIPEDELTIVERMEKLRFHFIAISTFTAAYHNLVASYLSGAADYLRRPDICLHLTSNEWPEESLAMLEDNIWSGNLRRVNLCHNPPYSFELFEHLFRMVEADTDSFIRADLWINAVFDKTFGEELDHFRKDIFVKKRKSVIGNIDSWRWHLRATEEGNLHLDFVSHPEGSCIMTVYEYYDDN